MQKTYPINPQLQFEPDVVKPSQAFLPPTSARSRRDLLDWLRDLGIVAVIAVKILSDIAERLIQAAAVSPIRRNG